MSERADIQAALEVAEEIGGTYDAETGEVVPLPETPESRKAPGKPASTSEKPFRHPELESTGKPPVLSFEKDILSRFKADLRRAGLAGEEKIGTLLYLALTSRVLPWGSPTERPVSVVPRGTSSTGKSAALKAVLRFFPESAYLLLGSMSKRYLFYSEEPCAHRFIVVYEWASIAEDPELVALVRTLLSEGQVVHGTVDGDGKRTARKIVKEGPTGLLMTTTAARTEDELETRVLSPVTDDTPEQTRRVFKVLAALENEDPDDGVDFAAWHELQEWIAEQESRVAIPFLEALAELMPTVSTRLRRDFVSLVCLVRAHAILHQATRDRDARGRIVATIDGDYTPVHELAGALIAESADAHAGEPMRETVEAVRALIDEGAEHVRVNVLIDRLGIGKSATYDRVRRALSAGYLENQARRGAPLQLTAGAPLPGESDFLPTPDALFRCIPVGQTGNDFGSTMRVSESDSGVPAVAATSPYESADDDIERLMGGA